MLDTKASLRQLFASLGVCIGCFSTGCVLGWTAAAIPDLENPETGMGIDMNQASWIASILAIGGPVGTVIGALIMERIGRKKSLILSFSVLAFGWFLICVAWNVAVLYAARFTQGMALAFFGLVGSVYLGEIASSSIRGRLSCLSSAFLAFGLVFVSTAGAFTSWRVTAIICFVPHIAGIILLICSPESPYFLAWKGQTQKARENVEWLMNHNVEDADDTMKHIADYLATHRPYKSAKAKAKKVEESPDVELPVSDSLLERLPEAEAVEEAEVKSSTGCLGKIDVTSLKLTLIMMMVLIVSRSCGITSLTWYMVDIFQKSNLSFSPYYALILVSVANFLGTLISMVLTDKLGRKTLLVASGCSTSICLIILAWSFMGLSSSSSPEDKAVEDVPEASIIPFVSVFLYFLFFSCGLGPVPFVQLSEIFPAHFKGMAIAICTISLWIFNFFMGKLFFLSCQLIGIDGTFFFYAICTLIGLIFIVCFVPETKNKTLAEIQTSYKIHKRMIDPLFEKE